MTYPYVKAPVFITHLCTHSKRWWISDVVECRVIDRRTKIETNCYTLVEPAEDNGGPAQITDEVSSVLPPRRSLMAKGGGTSGLVRGGAVTKNTDTINDISVSYQGYDVLGGLPLGALGSDYQAKQYIARANRVVGGMLITQHRRAEGVCKTRFGSVGAPCQQGETLTGRFGVDPVFEMSAKSLYRPTMDGDEALFYNISAGNQYVRDPKRNAYLDDSSGSMVWWRAWLGTRLIWVA